jgi:hypothetical protein
MNSTIESDPVAAIPWLLTNIPKHCQSYQWKYRVHKEILVNHMIDWYEWIDWNPELVEIAIQYMRPDLVLYWPSQRHFIIRRNIPIYYDDWINMTDSEIDSIFRSVTIKTAEHTVSIIAGIKDHVHNQLVDSSADIYDISRSISTYVTPQRIRYLVNETGFDHDTIDIILMSAIRYYQNSREIIHSIFEVGYEPMIDWIMEKAQFKDYHQMYNMWIMPSFQSYVRRNYGRLVARNWYGLRRYRYRLISTGFMSRDLFQTIDDSAVRSRLVADMIQYNPDCFEWEPTQDTWNILIRRCHHMHILINVYEKWGPFTVDITNLTDSFVDNSTGVPINYHHYMTERLNWYNRIAPVQVRQLLQQFPQLHPYIYLDALAGVDLTRYGVKSYRSDIVSMAKIKYMIYNIVDLDTLIRQLNDCRHVDGYRVLIDWNMPIECLKGFYYPLIVDIVDQISDQRYP